MPINEKDILTLEHVRFSARCGYSEDFLCCFCGPVVPDFDAGASHCPKCHQRSLDLERVDAILLRAAAGRYARVLVRESEFASFFQDLDLELRAIFHVRLMPLPGCDERIAEGLLLPERAMATTVAGGVDQDGVANDEHSSS